jgi:hypothetical protein
VKTVFILGAGTSRAAGGPLMYDFIDAAAKVLRRGEAGWAEASIAASLEARRKLQHAFVKSTIDLDNIESLFATYEMATLIGRLGDLDDKQVAELPRNLRYLIMRTLEHSILYSINGDDDIVPAPYPYDAFAELLIALQQERDAAPVAIINFNYDLCLDYALHLKGYEVDYGLGVGATGKRWVKHYKVHGSLNWFRSQDGVIIQPRSLKPLLMATYWNRLGLNSAAERPIDTMELIEGAHMWGASLQPEPIIVPPTWNKGWYQEQLKSVWRAASEALSTAENIFVIGYSLPPSDRFFRAFWSLSSISDDIVERFWLFDPSQNVEIVSRFSSMLGPAIIDRGRFKFEQLKFTGAIRYIAEYFGMEVRRLEDR